MKKIIILIAIVYLTAVGLLFGMAPGVLSMIILGAMAVLLAFGFIAGIMPTVFYADAFRRCRNKIEGAMEVQSQEAWLAVFKIENLFGQKDLDAAFDEYKSIVSEQKETNDMLSDVEEYINEDYLSLRTWRGLTLQIPGTMTGLGILGTFIGLITGIGSIGFSTVDAALESISMLLAGIETAFYTSIAGVILSILFNIINHMIWNIMLREYELFLDTYHKYVIPSTEEQTKRRMNNTSREIIQRLDRLPMRSGYTLSRSGEYAGDQENSEQRLMQQVVHGLFNDEFTFYLQPAVELKTGQIVRAEAMVRWNHEVLGTLSPSTFLPVLEKNGYITKLDSYTWDAVCRTIRRWLDADRRPVPISVNVSQMDILAMDTVAFWGKLLKKYDIPPRFLELEIEQVTFENNYELICNAAGELRRMGFKVIMDGFDGDYISVNMLRGLEADEIKLDLQCQPDNGKDTVGDIYAQAKKLGMEMSAENVENTEQLSLLSGADCRVGQGTYFYDPMSVEDFEKIME